MSNFAQTTANDLQLVNGQLVLQTGAFAAAQKIQNRLQFFKGEWFRDTRLGVPYFQHILVKAPVEATVRDIIQKTILSVPGTSRITDLQITFDRARRTMGWTFRVIMQSGAVITGGSASPFIVEEAGQ